MRIWETQADSACVVQVYKAQLDGKVDVAVKVLQCKGGLEGKALQVRALLSTTQSGGQLHNAKASVHEMPGISCTSTVLMHHTEHA